MWSVRLEWVSVFTDSLIIIFFSEMWLTTTQTPVFQSSNECDVSNFEPQPKPDLAFVNETFSINVRISLKGLRVNYAA